MIVLEILQDHPLVHAVKMKVEVLEDGQCVAADYKRTDLWAPRALLTTLPMLVYGKPLVPEIKDHLADTHMSPHLPELGYHLDEIKLESSHPVGEWDVRVVKLPAGFFFFRRDRDTNGRKEAWTYHLFFTPDTTSHIRNIPPFWENPPIARLQPWRMVVDKKLEAEGLEWRLKRVRAGVGMIIE